MQKEEMQKEIREQLKNQIKDVQKLMTSTRIDEHQRAIYGIMFWNAMIKETLNK